MLLVDARVCDTHAAKLRHHPSLVQWQQQTSQHLYMNARHEHWEILQRNVSMLYLRNERNKAPEVGVVSLSG